LSYSPQYWAWIWFRAPGGGRVGDKHPLNRL